MKETIYFEELCEKKDSITFCKLCPIECSFKSDGKGRCIARAAKDGFVYPLFYGKISSIGIDPIEKKPLYHFHPSSHILSVGFIGCNLKCPFCQNYRISQEQSETNFFSSEDILSLALKTKKENGNIGIAFTYNEPIVNFEYVYNTAKLFKENNLATVLITNGYINQKPLMTLLPYIDALNIDIKGDNAMYKNLLGANDNALDTVLKTISVARKYSHVEVTTLAVKNACDWRAFVENISSVIGSIDKNIAYHISLYHPAYKYSEKSTTKNEIKFLSEIAKKHLKYVYEGNTGSESNTECECANILVERNIYNSKSVGIKDGKCLKCQKDISDIIVL